MASSVSRQDQPNRALVGKLLGLPAVSCQKIVFSKSLFVTKLVHSSRLDIAFPFFSSRSIKRSHLDSLQAGSSLSRTHKRRRTKQCSTRVWWRDTKCTSKSHLAASLHDPCCLLPCRMHLCSDVSLVAGYHLMLGQQHIFILELEPG